MSVEGLPTPSGPAALGPYSAAVRAGDWVVVSGQLGVDPGNGALVADDAAAQTERIVANLRAVLGDCGLALADVAKTTVFVTDPADFPAVNEAYARGFGEHRPARASAGVTALPLGAKVEIEAWAHAPRSGAAGADAEAEEEGR